MTRLFITSSGTGIGKTFTTAELARAFYAQGKTIRVLKPLITDYPVDDLTETDTAILLTAAGKETSAEEIDRCSPWRFIAPLSPDMAAAREGKAVDFSAVVDFCKAAIAGPEDVALIEGVGGTMVPLDETHTVRDWIKALDIPAVLVVGSYLGTISHTLTAFASLEVPVKTIIVNESEISPVPIEETAATIARFTKTRVLPIHRQRSQVEWDDVIKLLTT